jgi:hypothetical protein
LGVTVSILVLAVLVGTATVQLPALNQSVEAAPVQNSTALDGVIVKTRLIGTRDVAQQPGRRKIEKAAMPPRHSSIASAPTRYDSL